MTNEEHKIYYDGRTGFNAHTFLKDQHLTYKRFLVIASLLLFLSFAFGQPDNREYIVRKGDTLWDLAFTFLGDPFAWPQIWHQNQFIKDPNLIFPGEKMVIAKSVANQTSNSFQANNQDPSNPQPSNTNPSFHSEIKSAIESAAYKPSASEKKSALPDSLERVSDSLFAISMRQQRFFTSEFLEKLGFLWFGKDEKGQIFPGNAMIGPSGHETGLDRYETPAYQEFSEISIQTFPSATYKIGDTVSIFHVDEIVKFGPTPSPIVRRVGRAIIKQVSKGEATALLYKIWDVVRDGDRIDTLFRHSDMTIDTIATPAISIKGTVLKHIENTERPYLYHTFILDRGAKDGVAFGDMFALLSRDKASIGKIKAVVCALNVGQLSCTVVIVKLYDNDIHAGDTAVLIKRTGFGK